VDSLGGVGDPGDVVLTLEMIEHSRYAEYKYTVLAGRVAAICGVQRLDHLQYQGPQASQASMLCSIDRSQDLSHFICDAVTSLK
jgi:hypothetical protein